MPLESQKEMTYDKERIRKGGCVMTEQNEKKEKQTGGFGTLLTGVLILLFVIGFIAYQGGYLDEKLAELGVIEAKEEVKKSSEEKLDKDAAVQVTVGQDFTEYIDYEKGTLIRFKAEETGRYYIKATMNDPELSMHVYKYQPWGNDLIGGMLSDGDRSGSYELELSGLRYLEGNTEYYAYFDWEQDCGVRSIRVEFEPLKVVDLNETLVKELNAVTLTEGEPYEGPFLVGEENWFLIDLTRPGAPILDLTYGERQFGEENMSEVTMYVQQEDGSLAFIGNNTIISGFEHNTIHRHAPVLGELPVTSPYFVSVYMNHDLKLKSINMKISGRLNFQ